MNYFQQASNRLIFRKTSLADIPAWTEFFEKNDTLKFLGIDLSKDAKTHATDWITMQLGRYEKSGLGHLAVIEKVSGEFIGMGGILPRILNEKPVFEIAYSLKPAFWGKGYGTELARQMKQFGKEHKIAEQFVSIIHKDNAASIHVAEKNGMCVLFETHYLGMDVFVYGIDV